MRPIIFGENAPISAGGDSTIKLWDADAKRHLVTYPAAHTGIIYSLAFHPSGRYLASASADKTIKLWEIANGGLQLKQTLTAHSEAVYSVVFSQDGRMLSGSADRSVILWSCP